MPFFNCSFIICPRPGTTRAEHKGARMFFFMERFSKLLEDVNPETGSSGVSQTRLPVKNHVKVTGPIPG